MEKERYEILGYGYSDIFLYVDGLKSLTSYKDIENLLNQQDKRVKGLERIAENEALEHLKLLQYDIVIKNLKQENQQLKEQQNSKAIEVLEKVKNELFGVSNPYLRHFFKTGIAFASCDDIELFVEEYIDNQIKELRSEK